MNPFVLLTAAVYLAAAGLDVYRRNYPAAAVWASFAVSNVLISIAAAR